MGLFSKSKRAVSAPKRSDSENPQQSGNTAEAPASALRDFSDLGDEDVSQYVDFGVFMVPQVPGLSVRPDSVLAENTFGSLNLNYGQAAVELLAVAAPKSASLWEEYRGELRGEVTKQGNTCEERAGSFGTELFVQLHGVQDAHGKPVNAEVRYCGVDGSNWFVRLIFSRPLAVANTDLQTLEDIVRRVVVVRGSKPMSPRTVIPVTLPADLVQQLEQLNSNQN